jgi:hypothetical protein
MLFSRVRGPRLAFMATLLLTVVGCNSNEKQTYPVRGQLQWTDGSAARELSGGMVVFQSDSEEISAKGFLDDEGRFVLGTYQLDDGAVAGKHKVAVVQPADEAGDYNPNEIVERKYESMGTTDLEATVEPKSNEIVLKVNPGAWTKKQKSR